MSEQPPIQWLTVADVATRLDLNAKTVYVLASQATPPERRLAAHRFGPRGGKIRFHPDTIAAYIHARMDAAPPINRPLQFLRPRLASPPRRKP